MDLTERREYLDRQWVPTYMVSPVFQRQVTVVAQTLSLQRGAKMKMKLIDDAFMIVAELWDANAAQMREPVERDAENVLRPKRRDGQ